MIFAAFNGFNSADTPAKDAAGAAAGFFHIASAVGAFQCLSSRNSWHLFGRFLSSGWVSTKNSADWDYKVLVASGSKQSPGYFDRLDTKRSGKLAQKSGMSGAEETTTSLPVTGAISL